MKTTQEFFIICGMTAAIKNQTRSTETSHLDWLPYAGIGIGTVTGIAGRFINQTGLFTKNCAATTAASSGIFSAINDWKQFEIKNFALATPLIPLVSQIAVDAAKDKSGKGIVARVAGAVKKNFTLEQGVYLAAFFAFGLTGSSYCHAAGMCSKSGFDTSGHMMLKTLCATILSKGATAIAKKENRTWRHAFNAAYAATDAVLIHNTVAHCHTVPEALAGIAWGLAISGAAKFASKKIEARQQNTSLIHSFLPH